MIVLAAFTVAGPLFTIATSAIGLTVVFTVEVLFGRFGSVAPTGAATFAVLASVPLVGAVPVMVMTTLPPEGNVGTLPLTRLPTTPTDPGHTAPPSGLPQLAAIPVTPAGTLSLNVAPLAELGPALAMVSV